MATAILFSMRSICNFSRGNTTLAPKERWLGLQQKLDAAHEGQLSLDAILGIVVQRRKRQFCELFSNESLNFRK